MGEVGQFSSTVLSQPLLFGVGFFSGSILEFYVTEPSENETILQTAVDQVMHIGGLTVVTTAAASSLPNRLLELDNWGGLSILFGGLAASAASGKINTRSKRLYKLVQDSIRDWTASEVEAKANSNADK